MSADLAFRCRCGAVTGVIRDADSKRGDRVVCHCSDCQAFATRFQAAERVMDGHGGTDLYQTGCARTRIAQGRENLACIHLTEKPTLRWYATCCDTPMFNTYANGRIPYVTTLLGNCDRGAVDAALGPPIGHLSVEEATSDPGPVPRLSMVRLMRRFFRRMVRDVVTGDRRRNPLFDGKTLQPIARPRRVGPADG